MITLENVSKKFGTGTLGLSNVSFVVDKGEFVFLMGTTGSGKTTILRLLIKESLPTQGSIIIDGWDLNKLPGKKIPELRKKIGVVFQDLKLLKDRTILENTTLPLEVIGVKSKDAVKQAEEILMRVGILDQKDKFPAQLSGGEKQRAAIARALILSPEILLADEPTGDLDDATAWEIAQLLSQINAEGTTIIMATHDSDIAKKMNKRIIELSKGEVVNDKNHKHHKAEEKPHEERVEVKKDDEEEIQEKESKPEGKVEVKEEKEEPKHKAEHLKTDDFEDALK